MDFIKATEKYALSQDKAVLDAVVGELMAEMTQDEKIYMLSGHALKTTVVNFFKTGRYYNATPYGAGGCERLKIPELLFADGPRGCVLYKSTCFPVPMLRGATFDEDLEYRIGEAIADECIAGGANYFAGICINLLRNPRWGRAQETYGEDQFLLGKMGEALTKAVQQKGVTACPKHFALNSIEDLRFSVDVKVDARTLREVYLPHFQKCIDAGALSIMGAYNKVNGTYCCESSWLLIDVLRKEMGFDGYVISDFSFAVYDAARSLKAGMDVEMPYTFRFRKIKKYLKTGKLSDEDIDRSVRNILSAMIQIYPKLKPVPKEVVLSKRHTELAKEAAQKGITLIKNKNNILPLSACKIAVVGRYADKPNTGDKGSSRVYSPYVITPYQGLREEFGSQNVVAYSGDNPQKALKVCESADVVIVTVGSDSLQEGEFLLNFGKTNIKPRGLGGDRRSSAIPERDKKLIEALAASGKKLIVNIMGGSAYIIEDWKSKADAIIFSYYSGLEGGTALAEIISGKVNPSGRLPFTIARKEEDYPEFIMIGDRRYEIEYDYYHGYALFDKQGRQPAYPFGFGLSYTQTALSGISAVVKEDAIYVKATVQNKGARKGATVVQVYAGGLSEKEDRPIKQLKGYKRVELEAKERKGIEIIIPLKELRYYNEKKGGWEMDKKYNIFVGEDALRANDNKIEVVLKG